MALKLVLLALIMGMAVQAEEMQILQSYQVHGLSKKIMTQLSKSYEIERGHAKDTFEVIIPSEESKEFLSLAPSAQLLEADISRVSRERFADSRLKWGVQGYRSLAEVQAYMAQLAQRYPDLAKVEKYGTSKNGKDLLALKVSDNVSVDENEPELMLTAATHGDEIITTEVLLRMIDQLLSHQEDPRMAKMVQDHEIYFIPVVNPDGFSQQTRYDQGRDPNRSYTWPENLNVVPTPSIAPLISFFEKHPIAGSIDFHAYGGLIMYPWAWTDAPLQDTRDLNWFDQTTKTMASANGYTAGPISQVIYIAPGSSADYYYWKKKTRALGIELGDEKAPAASEIPAYVNQIMEPTWKFIESF